MNGQGSTQGGVNSVKESRQVGVLVRRDNILFDHQRRPLSRKEPAFSLSGETPADRVQKPETM